MIRIKEEGSNLDDIEDDIEGTKIGISNEIYFLICQYCLWCASYIFPSCSGGNIESLSIAENEKYRFKYDTRRGNTMMFF
jgi:hypothetical protein